MVLIARCARSYLNARSLTLALGSHRHRVPDNSHGYSPAMTRQHCANCLCTFERGPTRCPACAAEPQTGDGGILKLDENARAIIRRSGGIMDTLVPAPSDGAKACIIWCEGALFRFDDGDGVRWVAQEIGFVGDVRVAGGRVLVNSDEPTGRLALDIETGAAT